MEIDIKDAIISALREALKGSSLEPYCYLVGGSVRDLLMGKAVKDYDICVELPQGHRELAEYLFAKGICSTPHKFKKHGLIACHLNRHTLEISQTVQNHQRGSAAPEELFGSLLEDALSRDFTINSLYIRISDFYLLDPTGRGLDDLKLLRLVSIKTPSLCFNDDPLRMMRAIRFSLDSGLQIAPDLLQGIIENSSLMRNIPIERVSDEFKRMLDISPLLSLQKLMASGLMYALSPCLHHSLERLEHDIGSMDSMFNESKVSINYLSTIMLLFWLGLRYPASPADSSSNFDASWQIVSSGLATLEGLFILSKNEKSLLTEIGTAYLYLLAKNDMPDSDFPDIAYLLSILKPQIAHVSQMLHWGKITKWHEAPMYEFEGNISATSHVFTMGNCPFDGHDIIPLLAKHEYKYTGLILLLIQLIWMQGHGLESSALPHYVKYLKASPYLPKAWKLYRSAPSKAAILWYLADFKRYHLLNQINYSQEEL